MLASIILSTYKAQHDSKKLALMHQFCTLAHFCSFFSGELSKKNTTIAHAAYASFLTLERHTSCILPWCSLVQTTCNISESFVENWHDVSGHVACSLHVIFSLCKMSMLINTVSLRMMTHPKRSVNHECR